jgi:glycosyltransferase involved in cell wall biosynthesis
VFPAVVPAASPDVVSATLPDVTIVLVNFNGRAHLGSCLDSIEALDYPKGLVTTVLVDNGSVDGSLELLAQNYSWVEVLPQATNLGFAPAVNLGAAHATTQCVAFVNNDMRLDPAWLRGLVGQYAPEEGFVCVAGTILDWTGEHLDFGDASINFHGFGQQQGFGLPVADARVIDADGRIEIAQQQTIFVPRDLVRLVDPGGRAHDVIELPVFLRGVLMFVVTGNARSRRRDIGEHGDLRMVGHGEEPRLSGRPDFGEFALLSAGE